MSIKMENEYIESEKIWRGPSLEIDFPRFGLGHTILENLKKIDPKKILEVEHESGATLTAGEMRSQTIKVAQNLMRLGVRRNDVVIIYSKSNIKITPITFALYTIGAPLNYFYLDLKGDDIKHYFEELDPTVILYEEEFKNDVLSALESLKLSKLKYILSLDSKTQSVDEVLFKPSLDNIESFQPPDIGDLNELPAILPFTSGSTGRPKIAIQSHAMVLLGLCNKLWHTEPNSVVCVLCDLRWMCQAQMMLQPVFFDVKRIYSSKCEKFVNDDYEEELLYQNKVTHFFTVPILLLHTLQNVANSNSFSKLRYLKTVAVGGEVVTDALIKYSAKIIPNCKIISIYGMSELHGFVASDEEVTGRMVNGGLLSTEYFAKIIDEHGNPLGLNEKGRLCLKSTVPIIGYFKNDKANKEHLKGDGWYTTDEYAYMDSDHLLNIVTRYKYLLRFNGKFVIPTHIENIINDHPDVLISALVGIPDPDNAGSEIGTIFVALKNDDAADSIENELISLLRQNLLNEQTKLVRFLKVIDKMPMLNYSKVNRSALRETSAKESKTFLRLFY